MMRIRRMLRIFCAAQFLVGSAGNSHATSFDVSLSICESLSKTAKGIMFFRQEGFPLSFVVEAVTADLKDNPDPAAQKAVNALQELAFDAFTVEVYEPSLREIVVARYSDNVFRSCMQAAPESDTQ